MIRIPENTDEPWKSCGRDTVIVDEAQDLGDHLTQSIELRAHCYEPCCEQYLRDQYQNGSDFIRICANNIEYASSETKIGDIPETC
jgi:hypothetical protein